MKKSRFSESQIVAILKEGEAGVSVAQLTRKHGISAATYYLDSPGGNIDEAIKIAGMIQGALLFTEIVTYEYDKDLMASLKHGKCASACFLIWLGGTSRNNSPAMYSVRKGKDVTNPRLPSPFYLHRPYFVASAYAQSDARKIASETTRLVNAMRTYLAGAGVPQRLIDEMMKRSSVDAYRPTGEEIDEFAGDSPWYEEWMLATCGANPGIDPKTKRSRLFEKEFPLESWDKWLNCKQLAENNARKAFIKSLSLS